MPRDDAKRSEPPAGGVLWAVEGTGCDPARLRSREALEGLFAEIVAGLSLHPVAPAAWHLFPGGGGLTGFLMLSESHLAVHSFPEHGSLCLDLFCCRPRPEWDWSASLARHVGARECRARSLARDYAPAEAPR